MSDMIACPQERCKHLAEVLDTFTLDSTSGSVMHMKTLCLDGHVLVMPVPIDWDGDDEYGASLREDFVPFKIRRSETVELPEFHECAVCGQKVVKAPARVCHFCLSVGNIPGVEHGVEDGMP